MAHPATPRSDIFIADRPKWCQALVKARLDLSLTQVDLSRLLGCDPGIVTKLERGVQLPQSEEFATRLRAVLRLSPKFIIPVSGDNLAYAEVLKCRKAAKGRHFRSSASALKVAKVEEPEMPSSAHDDLQERAILATRFSRIAMSPRLTLEEVTALVEQTEKAATQMVLTAMGFGTNS